MSEFHFNSIQFQSITREFQTQLGLVVRLVWDHEFPRRCESSRSEDSHFNIKNPNCCRHWSQADQGMLIPEPVLGFTFFMFLYVFNSIQLNRILGTSLVHIFPSKIKVIFRGTAAAGGCWVSVPTDLGVHDPARICSLFSFSWLPETHFPFIINNHSLTSPSQIYPTFSTSPHPLLLLSPRP